MNDTAQTETLDTYIRTVENQEIKGLLLKLKNEMRKPDVPWQALKAILIPIEQKDPNIAKDILLLLIKESE